MKPKTGKDLAQAFTTPRFKPLGGMARYIAFHPDAKELHTTDPHMPREAGNERILAAFNALDAAVKAWEALTAEDVARFWNADGTSIAFK